MSCLFISLGKLLNVDPTILRNQICDYIIANPLKEWDGTKLSDWIQMVAGDRYQSISQYIIEMRQRSQWGGAPEIAVCCMIYNISIEIVNLRNKSQPNVIFKDCGKINTPAVPPVPPPPPPPRPRAPPPPPAPAPVLPSIGVSITMSWNQYEAQLYRDYPGLIKMMYFRRNHPLRRNYDRFMNGKRQEFLQKQRTHANTLNQIRAPVVVPVAPVAPVVAPVVLVASPRPPVAPPVASQQVKVVIPTLVISWTGGHYEPVAIKNRRPS